MFKKVTALCIAGLTLLLFGCQQEQFGEYDDPSKPYDRMAICEKLTAILKNYDSPKDYKTKDISRSQLAKLYNDYKIYGCEK